MWITNRNCLATSRNNAIDRDMEFSFYAVPWQHSFDSPMEKIAADSGASIDRIVTLIEHCCSNYENSLWKQLVQSLEGCSVKHSYTKVCRLADLGKAATLLISQGLGPGNKAAEYVLRKIIREAYIICRQVSLPFKEFGVISSNYWISVEPTRNTVLQVLMKEVSKFEQSLVRGRREYTKLKSQKQDCLTNKISNILHPHLDIQLLSLNLMNVLTERS